MAALAMENYTDAPDELLEQARQVANTPQSAALMLAAINRQLAEIAPGEEPYAAAKRLAVKWDYRAIRTAYRLLNEYYEDSLDPPHFEVSYEDIDHEEHMALASSMLRELRDAIA